MINLSNILFTASLLVIAFSLSTPFINGAGCNALLHSNTEGLGELHGRCEQGIIYVTVSHDITKQTYSAKGRLAYIGGYYFIVVDAREIAGVNNTSDDWKKGSYFYRNIYAGVIQYGKFGTYLLSSSPEPLIMNIDIRGKMGFISPHYE